MGAPGRRVSDPLAAHQAVVIVGGGAAGTLAAIHLAVRRPGPARRIVVIEPAAELGRGAAYGTRSPSHLLNVRASGMSAFADDPGHFLAWAVASGHPASGTDFLPRMLYGVYLRQTLQEAIGHGRQVIVEHLRARATAIRRHPSGGWSVGLDPGAPIAADHVVLATGNALAPVTFAPDHPGFVADPWAPDVVESLRDAREVLLVGSGLTAVDVALTLRDVGHAGRVRMVSSHGLLPAAHLPEPLPPVPSFVEVGTPAAAGVRRAMAAARSASRHAADWRQVIDGARAQTVPVWRGLPEPEQRRFLRHLARRWDVRRHRMAPQVAAAIGELQATGALTVERGRVRDLALADGRIRAGIHQAGARRDRDVDAVVMCIGPTADPRHDPFLSTLLADGLATRHRLGLGLDLDAAGGVVAPNGSIQPGLWAMGALRKGAEWESTAVPELRLQARQIATAIIGG